jgi:hypothetical protein
VVSASGVAHCVVERIIGIWTEEKSRENFSFFRDAKNKNICFRQFGGHQINTVLNHLVFCRVIIRCGNQQNANFMANTDKIQKFVRTVISPHFQNLGDILPHLIQFQYPDRLF